jgi:hypothetical protein
VLGVRNAIPAPSPTAAVVLVAVAVAVAGCGGSGDRRRAKVGPLPTPGKPTADSCRRALRSAGTRVTGKQARGVDVRTLVGTFRYRTHGRIVERPGGRATRLPRVTKVIVSPARRQSGFECFMVQRRLSDYYGDTATVATRGTQVFVSDTVTQTGPAVTTIDPDVPLTSLSTDQLEWSGSFTARVRTVLRGITYSGVGSGQYAANVIGRKEFVVGGQRLRAVGVESRASFAAGDVSGIGTTVSWISPDRNVVVQTTVDETRRAARRSVRTSYTARLLSATPDR